MAVKKNPETNSALRREVLALIFLGLGAFLFLSVLSFDPYDPSFFNLSTNEKVQNWGGIVGAYLSDILFNFFGAGTYLLGIYFIGGFLYFLIKDKPKLPKYSLGIYFIFIILISTLIQLWLGKINFGDFSLSAGGLIGHGLAKLGSSYLGKWGTYILIVLGACLTLIWTLQFSVQETLQSLIKALLFLVIKAKELLFKFFSRVNHALKSLKENRKKIKENKQKEVKISHQKNPLSAKESIPLKSEISSKNLVQELNEDEPKIFNRIESSKKKKIDSQLRFQNLVEGYEFPPISLLDSEEHATVRVDENSLKMNAKILEKKLGDFNVEGSVTEIHPGPVITMYEFQPAPGVKLSKISNLVDDLSLAMGGRNVRIVAPLPNKAAVGIEIPNIDRETVWFKDVVADNKFQKSDAKLLFALGKDIEGISYFADLAKMPHLLVAGATGAGKSVSINSMIMSILFRSSPKDVRMLMIDPKMLELSIYEGIPHLLLPVVTDPKKANLTLKWGVKEMERRYKHLADINARNISDYNERVESKKFMSKQAEKLKEKGLEEPIDEDKLIHEETLPYIVIIVDELADLMMVAGREIEESIGRLAQMARAAGIHLILATQRPSVDVITGVIKANFPCRIAFKVSSKHDSRTILDRIGAERLLGMGDMLCIPPGASQIQRVHGAFVNDQEVSRVVGFLKKQGKPVYDESILEVAESADGEFSMDEEEDKDELYDQAVALVAESKQASISMVQRRLRVGYNRAARMIEQMEKDGIVSAPQGSSGREVLVSSFSE